MNTKPLIIALAGLSLTTSAYAADTDKWYVSGAVGITNTSDADFTDGTGDVSFDNDINFSGAVGMRVNDNIRTELELSYRKADMDSVTINGVGAASLGGDLKTTSLLANAYYDFTLENKFSPYVSAGIGMAHHNASLNSIAGIGFQEINDSDNVFAYQLGAGVSYDIADKTALFAGYRYFASSDAFDAEYAAQEVRVGVRYSF